MIENEERSNIMDDRCEIKKAYEKAYREGYESGFDYGERELICSHSWGETGYVEIRYPFDQYFKDYDKFPTRRHRVTYMTGWSDGYHEGSTNKKIFDCQSKNKED